MWVAEVNLLAALPRAKRDVENRAQAKSARVIEISRQYGEMYFDGPREYGYGGYRYDRRWIPVARDIVAHFALEAGMRVLDVGCAKGFLVKDLMDVRPGLEAFGIDISHYALNHCPREVIGRLCCANCVDLPFPQGSFDAVLSINTIHNLERPDVVRALQEIMRVTRGGAAFVQVDSYHTSGQRAKFLDWVLTARFHDYPQGWLQLFEEAGYRGDWAWTLV
jgi:ubiquinone/menaquinone biosynthesis C-methylase UbiE